MSTLLQTEFPFTLPRGYMDVDGTLHREGVMRLATAGDEIMPLRDPRVQTNPDYLVVLVLSRVVTQLGQLSDVNPRVIEGLFASDLAHLQELYNQINADEQITIQAQCPRCKHTFAVEINDLGGN